MQLSTKEKSGISEGIRRPTPPLHYGAAEDYPLQPLGAPSEPPNRRVQAIELMVFLFLIVPALSTSFLISSQSEMNFMPSAIYAILNDLGLVSLVFYFIWRNSESPRRIGWTADKWSWEVLWGLVLFLPVMLGANLLESSLHTMGFSAPTRLPSFLAASGHADIVLAVVLVTVVALVEETVFRGYLILRLNTVTRSPWTAVLLSSAVFALGHGYEGIAGVISVYFLGVVLALVYLWRRSLVAPMLIHFLIDFSSIVLTAIVGTSS